MIPGCPNTTCELFQKKDFIIRDGTYFRKDDSRYIARFKCKKCNRKFSFATFKFEYKQKKRRINHILFKLLASGISLRRSAILLNVHKTTVHRKLVYLAKKSRKNNEDFLKSLRAEKIVHLQFDDLISSVHTKLKPVSISIAVDANKRFILGAEVGSIPAFGLLADLSRKKYGKRKNEHEEKLHLLFSTIKQSVHPLAKIESDEHRLYAPAIQKYFPSCEYIQYKSERGCIVGQGELKKVKYDPLFSINHTCAMFRANINRLVRRTWCTSKTIAMLKNHIDIYIAYHNQSLVK